MESKEASGKVGSVTCDKGTISFRGFLLARRIRAIWNERRFVKL